jgi:hypothetical protein
MAKRKRGTPSRAAAKSTREKTGTRKKRGESPAPVGPRQRTLPTMQQVRHVYLDRRTARVAEIRTKQATLNAEEKDELRLTLRYMHDKNVKAYRQNGVEFERVEGEEKLRTHMTKETATEMLPTDVAGEGEDAGEDVIDAGGSPELEA